MVSNLKLLSLINSVFTDNTAGRYGGAVYLGSKGFSIRYADQHFQNNQALGSYGPDFAGFPVKYYAFFDVQDVQ
jgi:predicted outer membrane repeat protein